MGKVLEHVDAFVVIAEFMETIVKESCYKR